MNPCRSLAIASMAIALASSGAVADFVALAPVKDNTLYQSAVGDISNGAGDFLFAGTTGQSSVRRALIAFDVAGAIPDGATIEAVTLTLQMSRSITGTASVGLHALLADWGEGTSNAGGEEGGGAPATPGDATWIHTAFPSSTWANPGGDFVAAASATQLVGGIGSYTWTSAGLVADVQGWLDDPSTNFGWLIRGDESGTGSAKRFDSRESPTAAFRPSLGVTFTTAAVVPEPSSLALAGVGALLLAAGAIRASRPQSASASVPRASM